MREGPQILKMAYFARIKKSMSLNVKNIIQCTTYSSITWKFTVIRLCHMLLILCCQISLKYQPPLHDTSYELFLFIINVYMCKHEIILQLQETYIQSKNSLLKDIVKYSWSYVVKYHLSVNLFHYYNTSYKLFLFFINACICIYAWN